MDNDTSSALLRLEHLTFTVGTKRILNDINLQLTRDARTVFLGANGAGKSVLLRVAHGMLTPTSGHVIWLFPHSQVMVFQRPALLRASVLYNINYGLKLGRVPRAQRTEAAHKALSSAGLIHLAHENARTLSGGEQQKLALARAWARRPQVLFLDEPTSHLDPASTREVESIVLAMQQEGVKIIMATHDLGQAHRIAQDIIFLENGRVEEHTLADTFFKKPKTMAANRFLSDALS